MKIDYKNLTTEKLEEMMKELHDLIMSSYTFIKPKAKPENRKKMNKEIARIKTEITRRENERKNI